jgi:hypothetical protein
VCVKGVYKIIPLVLFNGIKSGVFIQSDSEGSEYSPNDRKSSGKNVSRHEQLLLFAYEWLGQFLQPTNHPAI